MNLIQKMSVKAKLLSGFLICVVILVIVGTCGIMGMNIINNNAKQIYNYDFNSVTYLHQIKETLLSIGTEIDNAILYEDNEKTVEAIKNIDAYDAQGISYLEGYGELEHPSDIKAQYDSIQSLVQEYRLERTEVLELASAGKYAQAKAGTSKVAEIRIQINEKVDALLEITQNNAIDQNNENKNEFKTMADNILVIVIIGSIIAMVFGLVISLSIGKRIKYILLFAKAIGEGDLTYACSVKGKDEIAKLSDALNAAREKIRQLIGTIAEQTQDVSASSEELSATLEEITSAFTQIDQNVTSIVGNIQDINATTEELSATVEQVDAGVSHLSSDSTESSNEAVMIKNRSIEIKNKGVESKTIAEQLSEEKKSKILEAIEQSKVVGEIIIFAESIASIAEQTNLLAINAAIEAARAGEQGKGFAVVASEIRVLSEQSSGYVKNIHNVINSVKGAVENLSEHSKDVLDFINGRVKDDYQLLIDTGVSYENDAIYVSNLSTNIASMSEELSASTQEIAEVTRSIACNVESTSNNSEKILESIEQVAIAMDEVANTAQQQAEIAERLTQMISIFKI